MEGTRVSLHRKPAPGLPGGCIVLTGVKAGINDPGAQQLLNATTRYGLQQRTADYFKFYIYGQAVPITITDNMHTSLLFNV